MTTPTLAEVIRDAIEARVRGIYTATVAKIVKVYPKDQTVDVELVMLEPMNVLNDKDIEHIEHPVIMDLPIAYPRGGGFSIFMPPQIGDHVLVIFTHESIAQWRETGAKSVPGDLRRHYLSHAVAYLGIGPQTDLLTDAPSPTMPTDEMVINGPGVVRVGSQEDAKFVALAQYVDARLAAIVSFVNSHTHLYAPGPSPPAPTAPPAPPLSAQASVAASKLKAE